MKTNQNPDLFIYGGLCGVIGTISYILAITFPFSPTVSFLLAMAWPILSIIFAFSAYKYISIQNQSISNQLAFIYTCIAFILVSIMISIQLVVRAGMEESITNASGIEIDTLLLVSNSLRWIDLGVDLAWDMFLGLALFLLSIAIKGHEKFGIWWSIPLALLAIVLVVTNLFTFPNPPDAEGLFDVGPIIGTFIIVFAVRIIYLGRKMKNLSNLN